VHGKNLGSYRIFGYQERGASDLDLAAGTNCLVLLLPLQPELIVGLLRGCQPRTLRR